MAITVANGDCVEIPQRDGLQVVSGAGNLLSGDDPHGSGRRPPAPGLLRHRPHVLTWQSGATMRARVLDGA